MKKVFLFLVCLALFWGCEKKSKITEDKKSKSVVYTDIQKSIDNSPVDRDTSIIKIDEKDYNEKNIYDSYLSDSSHQYKNIRDENKELVKHFLLADKQFVAEWKYWLYDKDYNPGVIILSEKNIDSEADYLKKEIKKIISGNRRWVKMLNKVYKICSAQSPGISCK